MGTILKLRTHKRLLPALALTILVVAIAGGLAAGGVFASGKPPVPPAQTSSAVPAQLSEHFAVLNQAQSADVPSSVQSVAVGANEQYGLNPSLAREAAYGPSTPAIWVIPGSQGICIHVMTEVPSGGCTSIKNALAGQLQIEVGGKTVYGLAPDGNPKVVVHDTDGSSESVSVEQNVYVISKGGDAQSVRLSDSAGQAQTINVKE